MNYCNELENIKNRYKNAVLWIGGDLNLPDIKWATNSVEVNQNTAGINNLFLDIAESCDLLQMVTHPTRKEKTLDLFITLTDPH